MARPPNKPTPRLTTPPYGPDEVGESDRVTAPAQVAGNLKGPAMTAREEPTLTLFDRLDAWRHLPAYQLERRADIFFSLYMKEVVENELGAQLLDAIIPEIPIKQPNSDQSFKADYLLTSADHQRAILVELKTDPRSRRTEQNEYLSRAVSGGIEALIEGIRTIVLATSAYKKYYHLLRELESLGYLRLPDDLAAFIFPKSKPGLTKKLGEIRLGTHLPKLELVFVQPNGTDLDRAIDFETFARHVAKHEDALSQRFAESLLRWRTPAGEPEASDEVARGDRAQPR